MESQRKRYNYLLYSCLFVILFVVLSFVCFDLVLNRVPPGEARPIDIYKLSTLESAVHMHYLDYGEIPAENELKRLLLERGFVEDETFFYSAPSGKEIRYFTSGSRFVFVTPGNNGCYDTPEGYEHIEASKDTGDDFVKFGYIHK